MFDLNFLNSSLNDLHTIFLRVCDKKSCNSVDRNDFARIKAEISDSFRSYEENIVDREITSLTSTAVLNRINDLNSQFLNMKHEVFDRFRSLEDRVFQDQLGKPSNECLILPESSSVTPPVTYASVTGSNLKQVSGAVAERVVGLVPNPSLCAQNGFSVARDSSSAVRLGDVRKPSTGNPGRNRVIINGSNKNSSIKTVSRLPRRKALFVSRCSPDTSESVIRDSLSSLDLEFLRVRRLKSRFQSYASFHIEVYQNEFVKLLDESVWPEGCIISEFRGRLRDDQVYDVTLDSVDVSGNVVLSAGSSSSAATPDQPSLGASTPLGTPVQ